MSTEFAKRMYGYDILAVNKYINDLTLDYEAELDKKKKRLDELLEENRRLSSQIELLTQQIEEYKQKSELVGMALIKAEESARVTIADAERKKQLETERISLEVKKWEVRGEEVRKQLIEFEEKIIDIMERYQSEVNYLASKDVKKKYFKEMSAVPDRTA